MRREAWKYYLLFFRRSYRALFVSLIAAIGQSAILVPVGFLIRGLFDHVLPARDIRQLLIYSFGILAAYLLNEGLALLLRLESARATREATQRLRNELLDKAYDLSRSYYGKADLAQVHSRLVLDTTSTDFMSILLLNQLLPASAAILILGGLLAFLSQPLFLVLIAVTPLVYVTSRAVNKRLRKQTLHSRRAGELFHKGMWLVLQLMDLTRMQAAERFERERQSRAIGTLRENNERAMRLEAASQIMHRSMVATINVFILAIGGTMVAMNHLSLGALLSFYVVTTLLKDHILAVLLLAPHLITGDEALQAIYRFLKTNDPEPYQGKQPISFRGSIEFQNVSFDYADHVTLRNVQLRVEPEQIVALVGPNGAGKSTIIHLLLGFYRPQEGTLCADGIPYDHISMPDLRRQIGIVPQDPIIFPGTIAENIAYGVPDASIDEVKEAACTATADEFIRRLPKAYETLVGERGMLLSGGQRQRIAVARALLRNPVLLILDEPTNHLDPAAMQLLLQNLATQAKRSGILLISHDRSVISSAASVILIEDGRITFQGSPEELKFGHKLTV